MPAEGAAAEMAADESVSVDRRAVYLPTGGIIRLRSPRLRRACKEVGVTIAELRAIPKDLNPSVMGPGVPEAVASLLRGEAQTVWEERIELVLQARERGIHRAAAAAKKAVGGGAAGSMFGGTDQDADANSGAPRQSAERNPMVVQAEEHMERVLRRQSSETERSIRNLKAAWELRVAEEANEEAAQLAAEVRHSVARERSEARAERARIRQSESMSRFSCGLRSIVRARRKKQAERSVSQEVSAARVRVQASEASAALLRRQMRAENKRKEFQERCREAEERQIQEGLAARAEYNAKVAAASVASQEHIQEQSAALRERDAKLDERMAAFFRMEEANADHLAARCRKEDERRSALTAERRRQKADALKAAVAATDAKSTRARKQVALAVQERRHATGAAKSSIELKAEACATAAARREELQGMQAAKALVKRVRSVEHVTRMRRLDDYRREQNLREYEERQARANAAIDEQRRLREEQRTRSRDLLVDRSSRIAELDRSLRKLNVRKPRPSTAAARLMSTKAEPSSTTVGDEAG